MGKYALSMVSSRPVDGLAEMEVDELAARSHSAALALAQQRQHGVPQKQIVGLVAVSALLVQCSNLTSRLGRPISTRRCGCTW